MSPKRKIRAMVKDYIAFRLTAASIGFAREARKIELENPISEPSANFHPEQYTPTLRIQEYAASAVIVSVAGLEGGINEMLSNAGDSLSRLTRRVPRENVDDAALDRWAAMWRRGVPNRRYNVLEKVQIALVLADLPELPEGDGPVQNLKALLKLRNALVHSEPTYRPHGKNLAQKDRDYLEQILSGKFLPSPLVPETLPFIWSRCLSADCAKWAVNTIAAFNNDLNAALGIPITAGPIE